MYSIGQLQVTRTQSYDLVERANYFRSLFKLIPAKQCDFLSFPLFHEHEACARECMRVWRNRFVHGE